VNYYIYFDRYRNPGGDVSEEIIGFYECREAGRPYRF
jgi:hypothetical protein